MTSIVPVNLCIQRVLSRMLFIIRSLVWDTSMLVIIRGIPIPVAYRRKDSILFRNPPWMLYTKIEMKIVAEHPIPASPYIRPNR